MKTETKNRCKDCGWPENHLSPGTVHLCSQTKPAHTPTPLVLPENMKPLAIELLPRMTAEETEKSRKEIDMKMWQAIAQSEGK